MSDSTDLLALVKDLAIVHGKVTLSSGREADYYVDAKRAVLRPTGFGALGELIARYAHEWEATAVGGLTMGADPVATAMLHAAAAQGRVLDAFVVRKEAKAHGTGQQIEGNFRSGARVVVVEDVITSGGSAEKAIAAVTAAGGQVIGVLAVVDREQGGRQKLEAGGHVVVALTTSSRLGLLSA